ncbi:hypothetical protein GCK72_007304 [Caenorhabditis remanei]|uniref:protein-serine/threonine phosphatase n=1 Tax=Caenorhabditis remanei TaxID=31234 RepID=A0A6A5HIQ7_CAERE|nr:hypothetical protein GCK72_007304 [Caenorhabditis remanei]KAF1767345.1 hypothetical protein GCK72_007304 [Caenorhabditis remanei]
MGDYVITSCLTECIAEYGERGGREVWKAANEFFAELPIACVLNENMFVAHGGISRLILKGNEVFDSIKKRPTTAYEWKLFIDILWSDPDGSLPMSRDYKLLFPVNKNRTRDADRYTSFGLIEVLDKIGMECLVRAHQVVTHGYEPFCATRCFTSYGSTNNSKNNNAAQTIVYDDSSVEFIRFKNLNKETKCEEDTTKPRTSKGQNTRSKNSRRSTSLENGKTK